jgi:hypothetical protein
MVTLARRKGRAASGTRLTRRRLSFLAAERGSGFRRSAFGGSGYLVSHSLRSDRDPVRAFLAAGAHRLRIALHGRSKRPRMCGDRGFVRLIFGPLSRHVGRKEQAPHNQ